MVRLKYRAVNRAELVRLLGSQCSPIATKEGYVVGPDMNNRLCHCMTMNTLSVASREANKLNKKHGVA